MFKVGTQSKGNISAATTNLKALLERTDPYEEMRASPKELFGTAQNSGFVEQNSAARFVEVE